jgi:hypothetical protein
MTNDMNPEIKTIFKVIFGWEDEKEEKWLEQMAADGWKLISVAPYVYKFQRSEPEKVVFRLDYKNTLDKDYQEYLTLFKDSGWELFATFANWLYFKIKPDNEEVPEIYNSGKAKAQKYRRLLLGLVPLLPIYMVLLNPAFHFFVSDTAKEISWIMAITRAIMAIFVIFMVFVVIKILAKIKKLESENKE